MQSELLKSFYLVESSYSKGKETVKWRALDCRKAKTAALKLIWFPEVGSLTWQKTEIINFYSHVN